MNIRVLGVDPGIQKMGIGLLEKKGETVVPLLYKTVITPKKQRHHKRLLYIYDEITSILKEWQPNVIALEDIYYGMSFKSAVRIGEARCAVILAATQQNIEVVEYLPTRVKSAVSGFGRAAKIQVQNMIRQLLRLPELPPTDTADALAIALCHIHAQRMKDLRICNV